MAKHRRISFRWRIWPLIAMLFWETRLATRQRMQGRSRSNSKTSGPIRTPTAAGVSAFAVVWCEPSGKGPVGTFPALVEVWITSPAGDPFCGVFPQPDKLDRGQTGSTSLDAATPEKPSRETTAPEIPAPGQTVEFTGTFLKIVRYTGADTTRLAPLIVGDQQPVRVSADADQRGTGSSAPANPRASQTMIRLIVWAVGLAAAAMVAFILARWHLRAPARSARRPTKSAELAPDLPLEFIEPHENP